MEDESVFIWLDFDQHQTVEDTILNRSLHTHGDSNLDQFVRMAGAQLHMAEDLRAAVNDRLPDNLVLIGNGFYFTEHTTLSRTQIKNDISKAITRALEDVGSIFQHWNPFHCWFTIETNNAELADFLCRPGELQANGHRVRRNGTSISFTGGAIWHLIYDRPDDDDMHVSTNDDETGLLMWICGTGYKLNQIDCSPGA